MLLKTFLWEVMFSIENAEIAIPRGDQTHIAGCVYRTLCCIGQVLFAVNRRYLINEKGALAEAAKFPCTIRLVIDRSDSIWAAVGKSDFTAALADLKVARWGVARHGADDVLGLLRAHCGRSRQPSLKKEGYGLDVIPTSRYVLSACQAKRPMNPRPSS